MIHDLSKPGHLLTFKKAGKPHYLYLYVREVGRPFASLTALEGIREFIKKYAAKTPIELEIKQFSEYGRIMIETDIKEDVINAPVEIFVDTGNKFKERLFRMCLDNLLNNYRSIFPIREIGPVARDYSFVRFDENFKAVIDNYVLKGNNVVVCAPRRGGKTSFMMQLVKEMEQRGYQAYYLDMENAKKPVQFSAIILRVLKNDSSDSEFEKMEKEIEKAKQMGSNYIEELDRAFQSFKGKQIILLIDEFSFLIEEMLKEQNPGSVAGFLEWFKNLRKAYTNIRFVLSGSVKFEVFKNIPGHHELFDDCKEYSLLTFDKEAAANLVEGLFYSEGIYPPEYLIEEILRLITPYFPYFLQIVSYEIIRFFQLHQKFPDKEKIESIIDSELIGTSGRRFLDQFLINLLRYTPIEQKGARAILNHLSSKENEKRNNLENIFREVTGNDKSFDKVMALVEYDFYVEKNGDYYRFNNDILKKWWKINFAPR